MSLPANPKPVNPEALNMGPSYTFYPSGRLESTTLVSPDATGNIYYHYLDENFNGQGCGRVDKAIRAAPDSDGAIAYTYQYFGQGPDIVINTDTTWSNGIYDFRSVTIAAGKTLTISGTAQLYSNSGISGTGNLNVQNGNLYVSSISIGTLTIGAGTTVTIAPIPGGPGGGRFGVPLETPDPSKVYKTNGYRNIDFTDLAVTSINYASDRMESKTLTAPDALGNIYYHYIDEDWNGQGYGRVDKSQRQTAVNSELSHKYIYDAVTGVLKEIKAYSDRNWTFLIPKTLQDFIDVDFDYFAPGNNVVDTVSGYPFEGYSHTNYTQPTNIGFYSQLLANVISGDIVTEEMSRDQAIVALDKMMTSLVRDQGTIGYQGLMPWMSFNGATWQRDGSQYGQQVILGDNVNLSASLGAAEGALMSPGLSGNPAVTAIIQKMETFLNAQGVGYTLLYDPSVKEFRNGMLVSTGQYVSGYHNFFGDEFRSGILFVTLRYNFDSTASRNGYEEMDGLIRNYILSSGDAAYTVSPWDGGAFQMLWPTLTMPEIDNPGLDQMLQDFVTIALDFSERNDLPGFLSACYSAPGQYAGDAGIQDIAASGGSHNQSVASLYTLGAAHMVDPSAIDQFLRDIFIAHPDLVTTHGLWEGFNTSTNSVVQEQIVANIATFLIGMAGKGPEHMTRYLQSKNLYTTLQSIYSQGGYHDILHNSTNIYTWGGAGAWDMAYIQNSINASGRKIKIRYIDNVEGGSLNVEFKRWGSYPDPIRFKIYGIPLGNTAGLEKEIVIDLPTTPALSSLDEVVFVISGGAGGPESVNFTDVEII